MPGGERYNLSTSLWCQFLVTCWDFLKLRSTRRALSANSALTSKCFLEHLTRRICRQAAPTFWFRTKSAFNFLITSICLGIIFSSHKYSNLNVSYQLYSTERNHQSYWIKVPSSVDIRWYSFRYFWLCDLEVVSLCSVLLQDWLGFQNH